MIGYALLQTLTFLKPSKYVSEVFILTLIKPVIYIRVTRNSNKIPILNSNNTVVYLTQVNEGTRYHLSTRLAFTAVLEYTA